MLYEVITQKKTEIGSPGLKINYQVAEWIFAQFKIFFSHMAVAEIRYHRKII